MRYFFHFHQLFYTTPKTIFHFQNDRYGCRNNRLHHSIITAAEYGESVSRVYHIDHLLFLSGDKGKH